jgi:hypothetical protein
MTIVAMPKAAVHEEDGLVARENKIRFSGQRTLVEPKSKAQTMQAAPY